MLKQGIDAAEEELALASQSWNATWAVCQREMSQTWNDFEKVVDDNATKTISDAAPAYGRFEDGANDHTEQNLKRRGNTGHIF
jgi:hypothetical protein